MDHYKELSDAIESAEYVLIGLGEEMQFDWSLLEKDERYNRLIEQAGDRAQYDVWISYLQRHVIRQYADRDDDIYAFLADKLEQKEYFVVSLAIDDLIYRSSLDHNRIVTPCGGFRKMQCSGGCTAQLWEPDENLMELAAASYRTGKLPEIKDVPVCPHCGNKLVFNQMGNAIYREEGYLEQWDAYKKWLQGTMNRTVCLIELGAGMQFPSVIRWPFEKMVMYHQKARLFRVHSFLFQVEEIADRACGIQADAKEFIRNWKINDGR